jgi:hypothetical protein
MKSFLRNNGLSLVFFFFFIITICGQAVTGLKQYNSERKEKGVQEVTMGSYLSTGHFLEATFENWESEFLQMALYVTLTMFLFQKGSSESKDPDKKEEVDREPNSKRKNAPWAVKKGGIILSIYKYSLSISLFLLFLLSFLLHWDGSLKDYNEQQVLNGEPTQTAMQYLGNSRLWFESFENWQSEFLSVFSIVLLSVYFRQKGSSQSKPVDAPHGETGD